MSFLTIFVGCSTVHTLQKEAPINFGEPYFQTWVAGIQGVGSGMTLFIPISTEMPSNIILDSVYFRGKITKLELIEDTSILYVGRFASTFIKKRDVVMSVDAEEEYGNGPLEFSEKFPFKLNDTECVVSFHQGNKLKYFKISFVKEIPTQNYPSAPLNSQ